MDWVCLSLAGRFEHPCGAIQGKQVGFPYTGHRGCRQNRVQFAAWERCFVRALPDEGAPYEPAPILARPSVAERTALNIREENFVMVDSTPAQLRPPNDRAGT